MDLALSPQGHLIIARGMVADSLQDEATASDGDKHLARIAKKISTNEAEGLFSLAAERFENPLPPTWSFWREFAARFLTELCHAPETLKNEVPANSPPSSEDISAMLRNAPPMQGGEYLDLVALEMLWQRLNDWVREQIDGSPEGVAGFLKKNAPLWHQVGRVCFHLAENKRDERYPFAFLATYAPKLSAGARIQYQPLSGALKEMAGAKNKPALIRLLSPIVEASQKSELVKRLVESGDVYQPLAWTPQEAYRFLKDSPIYEECGILVRLPDWWKKRPRPRVGVTIGDKKQNSFSAQGMLDFKLERALGDQILTDAEWNRLMTAEDGLVLLRGQWVEVDRQKLEQALDHWKELEKHADDGISFIEGMRLLAGAPPDLEASESGSEDREWSFVNAGRWLGDMLAKMHGPEMLGNQSTQGLLRATLRKYQEIGVNWLRFLSSLGLGACLADDMGLGKTIQVLGLLAAVKKQKSDKPSLLVLPASLLANWKAELARFAPQLSAKFVHPSETPKDELERMSKNSDAAFQGVDVALTTYGMLLRQEWLLEKSWQVAVLDEAQAIKNPTARQTKAVKKIKADARIALTGTPVENRLGDLWSLFDFLCPGLLGTQKKFKEFVKQLGEREQNRYAPLRGLVQPYLLRRLKTDRKIIDDLPEKTEVRAFCGLGKRQAALYAKMVAELADALQQSGDGMKRRGLVLAYLMRFKQLCNHPSQLLGDGKYAPEESGKFSRLAEICEEIASRQEKTLLFTQFREMTDPLAHFLAGIFGQPGLTLHGDTAVKQRQNLVDHFQRDDGPPFFVLSLKAGGTGLNLTAASHVIHFDRWWNPAVENQATDRAFRIGQKRNVLVHKFVCRGTVEEKIDALIEEKTQLASEILEGGAEKMLTEMSDAELIRFVSLDVNRACE
jgi:non-specific serine/threonine protein kinase